MEVYKMNNIAITSDLHVGGQFEAGIEALLTQFAKEGSLCHFDLYINGDGTPFTERGWVEDPGYQAKKRIRKETGDETLAREAQKKAWDIYKDEMIEYGLRSHRLSVELIGNISRLVGNRVINEVQKLRGNSTPIISIDQRKALDLKERKKGSTMEEMLKDSPHIRLYDDVSEKRYNSALLVSIPYSECSQEQEDYLAILKKIPTQSGITDVFLIYHENRFPELVGMEGKPVMMKDCLGQAVDILKTKYSQATVYEVVGHNHVIPEDDFRISTEDKTLLVPVGVDSSKLIAATLVIVPGNEIQRVDYDVSGGS
jgi:hypothetical protein